MPRRRKDGYPQKFKMEFIPLVYEMAKSGTINRHTIGGILGISGATFTIWKNKIPAFKGAFDEGSKVFLINSIQTPVNFLDNSEKWVEMRGFKRKYKIGDKGNIVVFDEKNNIWKPINKYLSIYGYNEVSLFFGRRYKRFRLCRLVAQHFIPNPKNKPHVNHIDSNRSNDCVENLEWVTRHENMQHALKYGGWKPNFLLNKRKDGSISPTSKQVFKYDLDNKLVGTYASIIEAAKLNNGNTACISNCCNGHKSVYFNHKWSFEKL